MKKTLAFIFPFLFAFLVMPMFANATNTAMLSKVSGDVAVFKAGMNEGYAAKLEMLLRVGDKVVTKGKGSSADITFPNGDVVRIMSDSKLLIKVADFKKKSFFIRMKLLSGKVFNIVNKVDEGSTYEVETRAAVAGVRGTVWSIETTNEKGGEDVIMVKEGKVATMSAKAALGGEVLVGSLKKTRVKAGEAPSEPEDLTPAEIAMFDVLDDLHEEIKEDIMDEIRDSVAEDLLDQGVFQ